MKNKGVRCWHFYEDGTGQIVPPSYFLLVNSALFGYSLTLFVSVCSGDVDEGCSCQPDAAGEIIRFGR
jgi:hypothetical protein